jgi:dienelactone hydrolase
MRLRATLICVFIGGLYSLSSLAAETMSSDRIRAAFSGKTAVGENVARGVALKDYFREDGTFLSTRRNGRKFTGKWWLAENGDVICIRFDEFQPDKKFCHRVVADGKGGYDRILKNGKPVIHYERVVDGDQTAWSGGAAPSAKAGRARFEQIDFDSLDTSLFSSTPVKIKGYLLKAKGSGKAPGAVLAPACNGVLMPKGENIRPQYRKMARFLNEMGVTVLLVDGFNPRGTRELCSQPAKDRSIDFGTRVRDSLGGLKYLRKRGDVDAGKIILVSWGATGSFQAINKASSYYEKITPGFAAAVMFYPKCDDVDSPFAPYAPVQIFGGAKDTWNPVSYCVELKKRKEPGSAGFDVTVYPDTYHAFDQPRPPSMITDAAVGPVMTGGNPQSAADAYKRIAAFLGPIIKP